MLQELLNSPEWQQVQVLWLRLQYFFEAPDVAPDWSLLRVWVDRELNVLQRLRLRKVLSAAQIHEIQGLFQQRFDQLLQSFYQQRQTPYAYLPAVPRGPYTRYQALGDLEAVFFQCQKALRIPQVQQSVRDRVLHDLNFEVVERYVLSQPETERGTCWQAVLERVVWLSWFAEPLPASWAEAIALDAEQTEQLALRALKSSDWVSVQCCAIRILARNPSLIVQQTVFLPLFQDPQTPESVILEILSTLQPHPTWEEPLIDALVRHTWAYTTLQRVLHCWVQLPIHHETESLQKLLHTWSVVPELQLSAWQALARTSRLPRPYEQFPEAYDRVQAILQEAVIKDHSGLLQQALQTCAQLKDPRFIPLLQSILNGRYRQHSVLEKMGGGFSGERQSDTEGLLAALEQLGCTLVFDEFAEKWCIR